MTENKEPLTGPIWCGRVGVEDFECNTGYEVREGYEMKDIDCQVCATLYLAKAIETLAQAIKK